MSGIEKIILVIKHGALGDFVLATGVFKAIRHKHRDEKIVLLTSSPYVAMARKSGFFDVVWVDDRVKVWRIRQSLRVINLFRAHPKRYVFSRIYDLQCSGRTNLYFKLLKRPKPEWVGSAVGCSHPRPFPRGLHHTLENYRRHLLASADLTAELKPDISWLTADVSHLKLPERFVLLIPSCSKNHSEKRWSVEGYVTLIEWLWENNIVAVLTGGASDKMMIEAIKQRLINKEMFIDLIGRSPMPVMAALSRRAMMVIGSDTGPMHLAVATGCAALVLFSKLGHAVRLCCPVGENVMILECDCLSELQPRVVIDALCRDLIVESAL